MAGLAAPSSVRFVGVSLDCERSRGQGLLHQYKVAPGAFEQADFWHPGDLYEPRPDVEAQRPVVGRVDAGDHDVGSAARKGVLDPSEQAGTDAPPAGVAPDVDGVLAGGGVAGPTGGTDRPR